MADRLLDRHALELVELGLLQGRLVGLEADTAGPANEDLVVTLTFRHRAPSRPRWAARQRAADALAPPRAEGGQHP